MSFWNDNSFFAFLMQPHKQNLHQKDHFRGSHQQQYPCPNLENLDVLPKQQKDYIKTKHSESYTSLFPLHYRSMQEEKLAAINIASRRLEEYQQQQLDDEQQKQQQLALAKLDVYLAAQINTGTGLGKPQGAELFPLQDLMAELLASKSEEWFRSTGTEGITMQLSDEAIQKKKNYLIEQARKYRFDGLKGKKTEKIKALFTAVINGDIGALNRAAVSNTGLGFGTTGKKYFR